MGRFRMATGLSSARRRSSMSRPNSRRPALLSHAIPCSASNRFTRSHAGRFPRACRQDLKCLQRALAVQLIAEGHFPMVPTIRDVIQGLGVLDAQLSGQAQNSTNRPALVNTTKPATGRFTTRLPLLFFVVLKQEIAMATEISPISAPSPIRP